MPNGPVPNVAETLEKHGILVIRLPLDTADVDAFSLPFHDRPVVVLGTDKNDRARSRFDGAHEHPTCLERLLATPAGRQSLELLPHDVVQALVTATAS